MQLVKSFQISPINMEKHNRYRSIYIIISHALLTRHNDKFAKWFWFSSLRLRPANVLTQIPSVAKHFCNQGKKNHCPHRVKIAVKWRRKNWNNWIAPHTRLILICHERLTANNPQASVLSQLKYWLGSCQQKFRRRWNIQIWTHWNWKCQVKKQPIACLGQFFLSFNI